ncbi:hypothetical protein EDB83DRAFT_2289649 [Lactarius deliciosus]|nr:hypothetical protein EDB83DRAFT_2289649 [Lactarius deliciosus]
MGQVHPLVLLKSMSSHLPALTLSDQTTEMAILRNMHGRITPGVAQAHIVELLSFSPPITLPSPISPASSPTTLADDAQAQVCPPLDTPDELALRALLFGITHRAAGYPTEARSFLRDAHARIPSSGSTWIGGVALFELAVLELREAHRLEHDGESGGTSSPISSEEESTRWRKVLKEAEALLDSVMSLSGSEVDLSLRLESRVAMLGDEIGLKREMLGGR